MGKAPTRNLPGSGVRAVDPARLERKRRRRPMSAVVVVASLVLAAILTIELLPVGPLPMRGGLPEEGEIAEVSYKAPADIRIVDRDATEESPFRLGATGDQYCQSKYDSHLVALDFARRGLDVTIVAPCGPVGPGDVGPTPTGRLILDAIRSPVIPLVDTVSNMIDVRDVARGHLLAAERGETGACYLLGHRNYSMARSGS